MMQAYPVELIKAENGSVIVQFPDVPGAMTVGADEKETLEWAQDALIVALSGYLEDRKDIPRPSTPAGKRLISLRR